MNFERLRGSIRLLFCRSYGRYSKFSPEDRSILLTQKLASLKSTLPEEQVFVRSAILCLQGKAGEALRLLQTATLRKDDAERVALAHSERAEIYESLRQFSAAIQEVSVVERSNTVLAWRAQLHRVRLLTYSHDLDQAITLFRSAIQQKESRAVEENFLVAILRPLNCLLDALPRDRASQADELVEFVEALYPGIRRFSDRRRLKNDNADGG